ncbi:MAG: BTAD domain-containing putative transcriptional regulator, partial [Candidatus Eremiobacterota bacterium]
MERLGAEGGTRVEGDQARDRGLLTLARALEERGEAEGAARTYRELADSGRLTRESVAARLGLGRLAGAAEESRREFAQAVSLARKLGPAATGEASLEAGLCLMRAADPTAWDLLEEARDTLTRVGLQGAQAQAALALSARGGQDSLDAPLNVLLQSEHGDLLAASVPWLMPLVLDRHARQSSPVSGRAAARLIREFPMHLARLLHHNVLTPAARRKVAETLAAAPEASNSLVLQLLEGDSDPAVAGAVRKLGAPEEPAVAPGLRVHSMGALQVYRGEEKVEESDWKTRKVKWLFAYLVAHRERDTGEDVLIEVFWPDDLEKGRRNLYSATSALRRCLKPSYWPGDQEYILRVKGRLQLNPAIPVWHDADELKRSLAEATAARAARDPEAFVEAARKVALLYRGPYLDGCYYDWALDARTRLETDVTELLYELASTCAALGREGSQEYRLTEALEYARRALELDPCHQAAHLLAIQVLQGLGRAPEAVRQFEACKRALKQLGMEPSIELMEAHQRARLNL